MGRNGILCIEGDWDEGLIRRKTVRPVLELLKSNWDVPFIHRNASTRDEFATVIRQWATARYKNYPLLYLAFHGAPGNVHIGTENIAITDLHELFGGGARGRVIHFGACETIDTPPSQLRRFLKRSGFSAVCGFREDVDSLEACALELVILKELSARRVTSRGLTAAFEHIKRKANSLARHLQFRFYRRDDL